MAWKYHQPSPLPRFQRIEPWPNPVYGRDVLLLLDVDDIHVFHTDDSAGKEVKKALKDKYKISDLSPATKFLGLGIDRDEVDITLNKQANIEMLLRRFDVHKANGVSTPMDSNVRLYEYEEVEGYADTTLYHSIVGSLMYAALRTGPDLAHTIAALSRYSTEPQARHMATAKRALRYLKKTATTRLWYSSSGSTELHRYPDSDRTEDSQHRKSRVEYEFMTNGPISWKSRKQEIVALLMTEAEYVAFSEAAREAEWLIQLQQDVTGSQPQGPTTIYSDSPGALKNITNRASKATTKHIDMQYKNTCNLRERGIPDFTNVRSEDSLADIMTKPLPITAHQILYLGMNLR
jgi:hypothetical protein